MQKNVVGIVLLALLLAGVLVVVFRVFCASAPPVVDGVISAGEYNGGMAVQLVGRWNSSWSVDAYIANDTEYVYVAVNEPVPPAGGSWIEFVMDPGPASAHLYGFTIWPDHHLSQVRSSKVSPGWGGYGSITWSAVYNTATEFKVKYTDYGALYGDTIKLAIDRNNGSSGSPPRDVYGYAAFWPQNAKTYNPYGIDPTTWGDVHLGPSGPTSYQLTVNSLPVSGIAYAVDSTPAVTGTPITLDSGFHTITMPSTITVGLDIIRFGHWEDSSTNPVRMIDLQSNTVLTATYSNHTIDGAISPGEYDGGMAVTLIGRTDPGWNESGFIDWDDEYLYVAVNEHVPGTTTGSWIEFSIDPNPGSTSGYLYAFILFGDHSQAWNKNPKPSGTWSRVGVGNFSVVSNAATEFRVKSADYSIVPGVAIKMAIDRNLGPAPPPPYGFAAFWPQGAIVYAGSPQAQPATWGYVPPQPCDLTVNSLPVSGIAYAVDSTPAVTGTPITLDSGFHTITMPSTITVGLDIIRFGHWEDSSTNPVRMIDLQSNTVLTATYSNRTIDGVIEPGEYDSAMAVELVGPYPPEAPFSPWTTDAYILWDTEYLYVAVNESVPGTGKSSWIEFQFNTSAAGTLHSFVLFADGTPQHCLYNLASPGWYWDVPAGFDHPYPWYAATDTATEFQVKYTDYGIVYGDLLKMSIDRGKDDFTYPPLGECSVWPNPCIFYPTADPSTWGDVLLDNPTLYITPPLTTKQYDDVGDTFEVTIMANDMTDLFGFDLNITWDNTLITFDHASYLGNLDAIWGATNHEVTIAEAGVTVSGTGYYKFVALSLDLGYTGSHALLTLGFMIQDPETNWKKQTPLHFETHKLSDSEPQPIAHTATDAAYEIFGSTPTLDLSPQSMTSSEISEEFEIVVAISSCAGVTSFDFEIQYNTLLLDYVSATVNPAYGAGTITEDGNGKVTGTTIGSASGSLALVTMRLKVAYNHIWKDEDTIQGWQNIVTGDIYIKSATLRYPNPQPDRAYTRGGPDNRINVGPDVLYTWSPIQGDVTLDGNVDIYDLRMISAFYDQSIETWNLTGTSNLIDIFDLVVIAVNFDFT